VKPGVLPAEAVLATTENPAYNSPVPVGVRLGKGTVVDEAPLIVPALSRAHVVPAPNPAVNSWAEYSIVPDRFPDHLNVMVDAPVAVTVPYQSSTSFPTEPWNCDAFFHVVTPPPEMDETERVRPRIPTTITSPVVLGDTAKVVRALPFFDTNVPTAVTEGDAALKLKWSALEVADVPPVAVTVTSTVEAAWAGEVTVSDVVELTVTAVPATVPNFTPVTPVKLVPVTVTEVPPAVDPDEGLTAVTVGAAT
jgi:hypothetical protein